MKWYFYASADVFGGFYQSETDPGTANQGAFRKLWHGPYEYFGDCKAAAKNYFKNVIDAGKQALREVEKADRPKPPVTLTRDKFELDAEHDQHPERSPAR